MARLFTSGFELNSTTAGVEITTVSGSPSIVTNPVRSGTYALRINNSGSSEVARFQFDTPAGGNSPATYTRMYFYIAAAPTVNSVIAYLEGGDIWCGLQLNTDRTVTLVDVAQTQDIGSPSTALALNTWHMAEMYLDSSGNDAPVILRINGVEIVNTSHTFASGASPHLLGIGTISSDATLDIYFDDIALNDTSGSFQNSWPGEGKCIHLKPNAAGDNNGWLTQVGGTAGSTNNFTRVNEVPPDDVTSYNGSHTLNVTDDFNIENPAIASGDAISCVHVGIRYTATGTSAPDSFVVRVKASPGGTTEESSAITPNSTSWNTNANASPIIYPLTLYDLPGASTTSWTKADLETAQIGYRLSNAATNGLRISNVWMVVEYVKKRSQIDMPRTEAGQRQLVRSFGTSLRFNGTDTDVTMTSQAFYNNTSYSVSLWLRGLPQTGRILTEGNTASNNTVWSMEGTNAGKIAFLFRDDGNGVRLNNTTVSTTTALDGNIHHIVFTDANGTAKLYIDGVLDATSFNYTRTGTFTLNRVGIGALVRAAVSSWFKGMIDDVRVYSGTILSQTDVTNLYYGLADPSGITARWALNEGSGTSATDSVGSNTGVITNATYVSDVFMILRSAAGTRTIAE